MSHTDFREGVVQGRKMDLKKLPERPVFENLPRRWVAERAFAWTSHNRRMSKDHESLCSTGEAFVHAAMARLVVRRLARALGFADALSTRLGEQGLYVTASPKANSGMLVSGR